VSVERATRWNGCEYECDKNERQTGDADGRDERRVADLKADSSAAALDGVCAGQDEMAQGPVLVPVGWHRSPRC
jgi:hypothetical protein